LDALYTGSDFLFNLDRNTRLNVRCDVEGYFYVDINDTSVSATEDFELLIPMELIKSGKSLVIQDIEFTPGTSEITKNSEPRLRRLKDFLALNSNLKIEIQGHVFALGDNSFAGQKISEARAKRVMTYLIDNGIDKSRLKAVGYGNTRPIYPEPKFSYEEQANRRVEIVVL
jgi:outer membrane protein OmpA-like peptidoglycan-associated protein